MGFIKVVVGLLMLLLVMAGCVVIWFMLLLKKVGYYELYFKNEVEKEKKNKNGKKDG